MSPRTHGKRAKIVTSTFKGAEAKQQSLRDLARNKAGGAKEKYKK